MFIKRERERERLEIRVQTRVNCMLKSRDCKNWGSLYCYMGLEGGPKVPRIFPIIPNTLLLHRISSWKLEKYSSKNHKNHQSSYLISSTLSLAISEKIGKNHVHGGVNPMFCVAVERRAKKKKILRFVFIFIFFPSGILSLLQTRNYWIINIKGTAISIKKSKEILLSTIYYTRN